MADVALDGIIGNNQFLGNLLVGGPLGEQLQDLQLSFTQGFWQLVSPGRTFCRCPGLALLLKCSKQGVEIGSWPTLAIPPAQAIEQRLHCGSFIHEATDVALRLAQANCLREGIQSLCLLMVHLMSYGL